MQVPPNPKGNAPIHYLPLDGQWIQGPGQHPMKTHSVGIYTDTSPAVQQIAYPNRKGWVLRA